MIAAMKSGGNPTAVAKEYDAKQDYSKHGFKTPDTVVRVDWTPKQVMMLIWSLKERNTENWEFKKGNIKYIFQFLKALSKNRTNISNSSF